MSESIMHLSPLLPAHQARLAASGINPATIQARGYYSESSGAALGRLGFTRNQHQTPALVIPVGGLKGRTLLFQIRPDNPRISNGREVKYETPSGSKLLLDIPSGVVAKVLDPEAPLLITEGVFKADSAASRGLACIACLGVYGWSRDVEAWDAIPLQGRRVFIAFDSDIGTNETVHQAARKLAKFLEGRGAKVQHILFDAAADGKKVGLDDFLATGRSADELFALATAELPPVSSSGGEQFDDVFLRYEATDDGLFKVTKGKNGEGRRALANFNARIVAELVSVEEPDQPREFEIEVRLNGRCQTIIITAVEFERLNWVITRLGAEARVEAGNGVKDEVRAAIQYVSGAVRKVETYQRLGWLRRADGTWVYLHAGGYISADSVTEAAPENRSDASRGPVTSPDSKTSEPPISRAQHPLPEIRVHKLPASLGRYELIRAKDREELIRSVQISLDFLNLAPDRITFPLYAYFWRVLLDIVRFGMFLVGPTGLGKTEISALIIQHLGPGMDSSHLPESFGSTTFSLAATAHSCRNAPLIVDDFVPKGSHANIQRLHEQVDQLLRGLGNQAGRNRCARDGTTLGGKPPGGGLICSGEDTPQGQSLSARYFLEEFSEGDVFDKSDPARGERFSEYQKLAAEGWLAKATTGFLEWVAPRYEQEREELKSQQMIFRDDVFRDCSAHPRVVANAADLLAGIEPILVFALGIGAIDQHGFDGYWSRAQDALLASLEGQEENRVEQDPAERFLELLVSAVATGKAYLVWDPEDQVSAYDSAKLRGYQKITRRVPVRPAGSEPDPQDDGPEFEEKEFYEPQGRQIGWWRCHNIYLDPQASMEIAQLLARDAGQAPLPFGKKAMGKRLAQADKLESSSKGRNTAKFRTDCVEMDTWHILAATVYKFFAGRDFEEEYLSEQQELERRREERDRAVQNRLEKARKLRTEEFVKLLNLIPEGRAVEKPSAPPEHRAAEADSSSPIEQPSPVADLVTTTTPPPRKILN